MTTKRFYEINSQMLGLKTIQDKNRRYTFPPLKTEKNHMFLKALNELVVDYNILKKENEQLKKRIKVLEDSIDGLTGTIAHYDIDEVLND